MDTKKVKTVKVGDQECRVETLREWLNDRMTSLRRALRTCGLDGTCGCTVCGGWRVRLAELSIIREKINDGRIQEIQ